MWITALVIGFAGSMHCMGMCGPLVLAVSSISPSAVASRLLYNGGRITTYALMGALISGVGFMLPLYKFQNLISIVAGIILLLIGFSGFSRIRLPGISSLLARLSSGLKNLFAHYLRQNGRGAIIILGALNGLLPCGLTFIALTYCLTLKGPLDGFNFMLMFGAGTLPVMLGFTGTIRWIVTRFSWSMQKVTTTMLILSGVVLIVRVFVIHIPHAATFKEGLMDIIICR